MLKVVIKAVIWIFIEVVIYENCRKSSRSVQPDDLHYLPHKWCPNLQIMQFLNIEKGRGVQTHIKKSRFCEGILT